MPSDHPGTQAVRPCLCSNLDRCSTSRAACASEATSAQRGRNEEMAEGTPCSGSPVRTSRSRKSHLPQTRGSGRLAHGEPAARSRHAAARSVRPSISENSARFCSYQYSWAFRSTARPGWHRCRTRGDVPAALGEGAVVRGVRHRGAPVLPIVHVPTESQRGEVRLGAPVPLVLVLGSAHRSFQPPAVLPVGQDLGDGGSEVWRLRTGAANRL